MKRAIWILGALLVLYVGAYQLGTTVEDNPDIGLMRNYEQGRITLAFVPAAWFEAYARNRPVILLYQTAPDARGDYYYMAKRGGPLNGLSH